MKHIFAKIFLIIICLILLVAPVAINDLLVESFNQNIENEVMDIVDTYIKKEYPDISYNVVIIPWYYRHSWENAMYAPLRDKKDDFVVLLDVSFVSHTDSYNENRLTNFCWYAKRTISEKMNIPKVPFYIATNFDDVIIDPKIHFSNYPNNKDIILQRTMFPDARGELYVSFKTTPIKVIIYIVYAIIVITVFIIINKRINKHRKDSLT